MAKDIRRSLKIATTRTVFGTYGSHGGGVPCLWGSKAEALENHDIDERVYKLRLTVVSEVRTSKVTGMGARPSHGR